MAEFKRELRYVVLKVKDIEHLSLENRKHLIGICDQMKIIRADRGKEEMQCVVVEHDWPEYEYVWGLIQHRMEVFQK